MKITYNKNINGNPVSIDITEIHFEESERVTRITCEFKRKVPKYEHYVEQGQPHCVPHTEDEVIATGLGLNAGEAFMSALKDLADTKVEIENVEISDR